MPVPFSELLRKPVETTGRLAQERSVRLSRRDAQDLVLMYADRADAESRAFEVTGRLLVALVRHHPQLVSAQLPTVLPWARFLPPADVEQLAAEFVAVAEACGSTGNLAPLAQLLTEWQHTAEVHADPQLHQALTRDHLGDHGPVPVPATS
ncbi:MAG TPA: DUF6247 family protein [Kineosporiaceae bacterium]